MEYNFLTAAVVSPSINEAKDHLNMEGVVQFICDLRTTVSAHV